MLPPLQLEDNGVPVYVQIRDQLLQAIGAGILRPGEQMPTMRQVAVSLKVDLNTVRHAYADLEQTGAIVILRARGTYVADKPPPVDVTRQAKRVASLAQQAIAISNSAGVDPIDVAQEILRTAKRLRTNK
ncbi:MAG: GntR family transcriptional regulator [Steroidobacteraceae bacterium]